MKNKVFWKGIRVNHKKDKAKKIGEIRKVFSKSFKVDFFNNKNSKKGYKIGS